MDPRRSDAHPTSVYVHVPFCVVKCGYCDFNSYPPDAEGELDRYLVGLSREFELQPLPARPVSIFIGGGTPSFLDAQRLERMLAIVASHFDLAACPEVTMEANPESVTPEKARIALAAGVNRVSIGAQSFDADHLRFLDRAHDADQTRAAVAAFRAAGCENLSLDLIFSLPGQTLAQWQSDLREALALEPDHLSCYNLAFEPGTRLTRDLERGRVAANPDTVDRDMFLHTRSCLEECGFTAYETSNFAGRGGPSRHNDHYWLQGDYVGVGPGASDHRQGVRSTNFKPLEAWAQSLDRGLRPTASAETLSPAQRAGEALWLGLRRSAGVDLAALSRRVGFEAAREFAPAIDALVAQGLIEWEGDCLRLTPEGTLFGNTAGEAFLVVDSG